MFSTAQSGTQPWWHAEEPKSELLILCSSSDAGCFKHKTETGIIYWTKCPENWAQRKIQVKAFAALPFLEDRIPPGLVQDQPSCRDILWNFTLWHFDCEIMRPHFTLYTCPPEVKASTDIFLWRENLASHVFGLWILLLPDHPAACFVSQFSNTFLDIDWKLLSHV